MGIESTVTYKRSTAVSQIEYWLRENKDRVVPSDNNPKALNFALGKLGITENPNEYEQPIEYLTEEEYESLLNNVEMLSNYKLEELLYKFRSTIFENYSVVNDEHYDEDEHY